MQVLIQVHTATPSRRVRVSWAIIDVIIQAASGA